MDVLDTVCPECEGKDKCSYCGGVGTLEGILAETDKLRVHVGVQEMLLSLHRALFLTANIEQTGVAPEAVSECLDMITKLDPVLRDIGPDTVRNVATVAIMSAKAFIVGTTEQSEEEKS